MKSFQRLRCIGGVAAAFLAAGCTSSNLSGDAKTTEEVSLCLPEGAPAPSLVARAVWFPHASGFGTIDSSPMGHTSGVLVLSGDTLYFMAWNHAEKHYDTLQINPFLPPAKLSVATLGPSAMLVIESGNLSFDGYELMKNGMFISDPEATRGLCQRIQALQAKDSPPQLP